MPDIASITGAVSALQSLVDLLSGKEGVIALLFLVSVGLGYVVFRLTKALQELQGRYDEMLAKKDEELLAQAGRAGAKAAG